MSLLRQFLVEVTEGEPKKDTPAEDLEFSDKVGDLISEIDGIAKETKDPGDLTKALKAGVLERGFTSDDIVDLINRISVREEPYWADAFQRFMLFMQ